ncbi:MAG TPA: hypothetical protein VF708_18115 [Pyrinomonadaceae bacterium]|jgi:hypothetical protein
MEMAVILFFIVLLIPGLWLILTVQGMIKGRERLEEEWRIERERINWRPLRRRISRRPVQEHNGSPAEELASKFASAEQALQAREAASVQSSKAQAADPWHDFNASQLSMAFESFLLSESPSTDLLTTSQINEAFDKFLSG